jgi:hypothetical protein
MDAEGRLVIREDGKIIDPIAPLAKEFKQEEAEAAEGGNCLSRSMLSASSC